MLPTGASTFHSFEDVDALSDAFAAFLVHDMELEAGEVIAVQLPTCLHYPIAVFGAWKAGLIVTNVNPLYTEREARLQLQDSGARLLLASELFLQVAQPVAAELGLRLIAASPWDFFAEPVASAIRDALPASGRPVSDAAPIRMADALQAGQARSRPTWRNHPVALYQYTGGTTGRSKGAVITHRNILATLQMTRDFLQAYDGPRRGETILTVLPL